jgi:acetyl esterase/lipase
MKKLLICLAAIFAVPGSAFAVPTVSYGPNAQQVMDIYSAKGAGIRPGVILIHGGGWMQGDQKVHAETAKLLQAKGYTVASITYRKGSIPTAYSDVKKALAYFKANYRVGPIAAWGDSAGGHLSLLLGTQKKVQAVVAWSPPTSLVRFKLMPAMFGKAASPEFWGSYVYSVMGTSNKKSYAALSPLHNLKKGSAPVFLSYFKTDAVDSTEQGKPFVAKARKAGVKVTFKIGAGTGHGLNESLRSLAFSWLAKNL